MQKLQGLLEQAQTEQGRLQEQTRTEEWKSAELEKKLQNLDLQWEAKLETASAAIASVEGMLQERQSEWAQEKHGFLEKISGKEQVLLLLLCGVLLLLVRSTRAAVPVEYYSQGIEWTRIVGMGNWQLCWCMTCNIYHDFPSESHAQKHCRCQTPGCECQFTCHGSLRTCLAKYLCHMTIDSRLICCDCRKQGS